MSHLHLTREQYRAVPDDLRAVERGWVGSTHYVLADGVRHTFSLYDNEQQFPAPAASFALPFPLTVAYAYSPRENTGSGGKTHFIVGEDFKVGRISRKKGETLCKKKFWGLDERADGEATCFRCLEIAHSLTAALSATETA